MALIKIFPDAAGGTSEYWRVVAINRNLHKVMITITLRGYTDKAARDGDKEINRNADSHQITVPVATFMANLPAIVDGNDKRELYDAETKAAYETVKAHQVQTGTDENGSPIMGDWIFADAVDNL